MLGLDIDSFKVDSVNGGRSYIKHIESESIATLVKARSFRASTDFSEVKKLDAVIICVPTPLNKNREPDISYILQTGEVIAPHLHEGILVVLESTTYPGTTDEDLRAVLEKGSGLKAGVDFHLAFSPVFTPPPTRPSAKTRATLRAKWQRLPKWSVASPLHARSAPRLFARSPSKRWCACPHAARPKPPSCSRTFSAV